MLSVEAKTIGSPWTNSSSSGANSLCLQFVKVRPLDKKVWVTWLSAESTQQREEKQLSKLEPYRLYKLGSLQITKDIPLFLLILNESLCIRGVTVLKGTLAKLKTTNTLYFPLGTGPTPEIL